MILIVVSTGENQFEQEATQILKLHSLVSQLVLPNKIGAVSLFLFSFRKSSLESWEVGWGAFWATGDAKSDVFGHILSQIAHSLHT